MCTQTNSDANAIVDIFAGTTRNSIHHSPKHVTQSPSSSSTGECDSAAKPERRCAASAAPLAQHHHQIEAPGGDGRCAQEAFVRDSAARYRGEAVRRAPALASRRRAEAAAVVAPHGKQEMSR